MGMKAPAADELARRIEQAAQKALTECMADLRTRATQLAPIDTGTLRGSADHGVERTSDGLAGTVSFNTPYAAAQHEGHFQHEQGQRKYLEAPFKENAVRYQQRIADAIRRAI